MFLPLAVCVCVCEENVSYTSSHQSTFAMRFFNIKHREPLRGADKQPNKLKTLWKRKRRRKNEKITVMRWCLQEGNQGEVVWNSRNQGNLSAV